MKKFKMFAMVAAGLLLAGFASNLSAEDADKTITGNMVCGKCTLHLTKDCQNVVQVAQDGKTVNYFLLQNDASKDAHDAVCGGGSEKVTVTGTVVEKNGEEILTPSKIEVVKS